MNYWLILLALMLPGAKREPHLELGLLKNVREVSGDGKDKGLGLVFRSLRGGSVCVSLDRRCQSESHYCRGRGRAAPGEPGPSGRSCQGQEKPAPTFPVLQEDPGAV